MKATFWGVRGSIPTPGKQYIKYGGNSSCMDMRLDDGTLLIFDAGTGIRPLGVKLMKEKKPLHINLLLSHGHMDHVHGFPFFAPAYMNKNIITIYGCPKIPGRSVSDYLSRQMGDVYFPVEFDGLPARREYVNHCGICENGEHLTFGKASVFSCGNNHPGGSIAYKIIEKKKSFIYMTDNELGLDSADAFPMEQFIEFCRGVDILVHDAQYTPHEYKTLTKGWGHSTYEQCAHLATQAGVKKLVLFHHDPEHDDRKVDDMLAKTQILLKKLGGRTRCTSAREGMSLTL
jgi:phosphoribosyl 1,2-cyclic phosphodiesterase